MEEKPRETGLKLSMLMQPAGRNVMRGREPAGPERPYGLTVVSEPLFPARVPLSVRFSADVIDLLIILPFATALLFGLPMLLALNDEPPGSDGNAYAAIGLFMILIPVVVPLTALIYTGLAYRFTGNTLGKRARSLTVLREGGGPATRARVLSRSLFKWGVFVCIYFLWLAIGVILAALDQSVTYLSAWVTVLGLVIPSLALISVLILDRLFPLTRLDEKSLTDIVTGTEVVWRAEALGTEGR